MAKQNKLARVHYNEREDAFELYIYDNESKEWGFSCSTKCRAIEGETEANFIHFTFLKEVMKCLKLGYEVAEF